MVFGGSGNNCVGNTIYKYSGSTDYQTGAGIQYIASSGNIILNTIYNYNWGIAAEYGSSPYSDVGYSTGNNNLVTNCVNGMVVYQNSNCNFGTYAGVNGQDNYGWNSIYNNSTDVNVGYAYPTVQATLQAQDDYWGGGAPSSSVGSACYFYDQPWLTTAPPPPSTTQSVKGHRALSIDASAQASDPANPNKGLDVTITAQDSLSAGMDLVAQNDHLSAERLFVSYIAGHPKDPLGYVELYGSADKTNLPDITDYFSHNFSVEPTMAKILMADLYEMRGKPKLAHEINDSVIASNRNSALAVRAEMDNMLFDLYSNDDLPDAENILAKIKTQANLITPMELLDAEEAVAAKGGPAVDVSTVDQLNPNSNPEAQLPRSYGLSQNYPNPFNPSTVIIYHLPKEAHVTITIYDVLGRKVATIVDGTETAGYHEITFNGSQLSSGVYFYRMTTPAFTNVKKMLMLK